MNYTYKQIWLINYPVMVSLLMEQLINLTDSIFLGHVGKVELGASALAGMYYTSIYMLGFGFSLGLQVMIARQNGEGAYDKIGKTFYQGMLFLLLLAVFIFGFSIFYSPVVLRRLITSDNVYAAVMQYVSWRNYSFLFAFPLLGIRAFFMGITRTGILTGNSILMILCNVVLNYMFIFGKTGFPAYGIAGAAMASSLAEGVALLSLGMYMYLYTDRKKYGLRFGFEPGLMSRLFKLSVWTMVRSFFCVAPWFLFFIAIEHLGETDLAAANIVRSVSLLFFVIVNSFATTNISLVSSLYGAKEREKIRIVCKRVILLAYVTGLPLILMAFVFSEKVLQFFTDEISVVQVAFYPLLVMLSTYLLSVPAYVYCNAVIGLGKTRLAFVFQLATIAIYFVYLFSLAENDTIPLAVYWTTEQLYVICLLLFSFGYMKRKEGRL
ncbi:MATE family efflux transporter [uncultured Sanguibacteroides sp.]|uniref:MATE family efflux transporter n=1 Tax=uncultured Sanguibacteroides sp. TaxID=1635151 RepID=UPI0025D4CC52|nr:MATE family efflux transporter [uncultured Sanguibacteroides sp.]